jgi:hypothetical protein
MQINGIARQLLGPLQFDTTSSASPASTTTADAVSSVAETDVASLGPGFHEILSRYDVKNITPGEFSDLVQELHDSGEINDNEFRQLSRIRLELEQAGVGADEPIDLVDFIEDKLRTQAGDLDAAQTPGSKDATSTSDVTASIAETKRQLDWVNKFALVHASGADGIDVGA